MPGSTCLTNSLRTLLPSCVAEPEYCRKGIGLEAAQLMMAFGMLVITLISLTIHINCFEGYISFHTQYAKQYTLNFLCGSFNYVEI